MPPAPIAMIEKRSPDRELEAQMVGAILIAIIHISLLFLRSLASKIALPKLQDPQLRQVQATARLPVRSSVCGRPNQNSTERNTKLLALRAVVLANYSRLAYTMTITFSRSSPVTAKLAG